MRGNVNKTLHAERERRQALKANRLWRSYNKPLIVKLDAERAAEIEKLMAQCWAGFRTLTEIQMLDVPLLEGRSHGIY